jgi:hypothetical protein
MAAGGHPVKNQTRRPDLRKRRYADFVLPQSYTTFGCPASIDLADQFCFEH